MDNIVNGKELDQVSGGYYINSYGHIVTTNSTTYSSGPTPKYHVGQNLKIIYTVTGDNYYCDCTVTGVSASANCGWFCKEFGYTVRILDAPSKCEHVIGESYGDVYESCLYEK